MLDDLTEEKTRKKKPRSKKSINLLEDEGAKLMKEYYEMKEEVRNRVLEDLHQQKILAKDTIPGHKDAPKPPKLTLPPNATEKDIKKAHEEQVWFYLEKAKRHKKGMLAHHSLFIDNWVELLKSIALAKEYWLKGDRRRRASDWPAEYDRRTQGIFQHEWSYLQTLMPLIGLFEQYPKFKFVTSKGIKWWRENYTAIWDLVESDEQEMHFWKTYGDNIGDDLIFQMGNDPMDVVHNKSKQDQYIRATQKRKEKQKQDDDDALEESNKHSEALEEALEEEQEAEEIDTKEAEVFEEMKTWICNTMKLPEEERRKAFREGKKPEDYRLFILSGLILHSDKIPEGFEDVNSESLDDKNSEELVDLIFQMGLHEIKEDDQAGIGTNIRRITERVGGFDEPDISRMLPKPKPKKSSLEIKADAIRKRHGIPGPRDKIESLLTIFENDNEFMDID